MRREVDVVVVGGGITGVATLRALARAGVDALSCWSSSSSATRAGRATASRGSSGSPTPIATYTRLAQEALASWRDLEQEGGERLIVHTGSLDAGDAAAETERSLAEARRRLRDRRRPTPRGHGGRSRSSPTSALVFQPDGRLHPGRPRAWPRWCERPDGRRRVRRAGRVVRIDAQRMTESRSSPTRPTRSPRGAVVVAAGAWAHDLLAPLGIEPRSRPDAGDRRLLLAARGADELPAVIEYPSSPRTAPRRSGVLRPARTRRRDQSGVHHSGPPTDPERDGVPTTPSSQRPRRGSRDATRTADPTPQTAETCIYTNTADESFVRRDARPHRRRLGVQRARLQVRAAPRRADLGARPRSRNLALTALPARGPTRAGRLSACHRKRRQRPLRHRPPGRPFRGRRCCSSSAARPRWPSW